MKKDVTEEDCVPVLEKTSGLARKKITMLIVFLSGSIR